MKYLFFGGSATTPQQHRAIDRLSEATESLRLVARLEFLRFRRPDEPTRTLVVTGDRDPTVTEGCRRRVAAQCGGEEWLVEGLCHDAMLDPTGPALASRLLAWLEQGGV